MTETSRIAAALASLVMLVAAASCDSSSTEETETHFLASCDAACPSGLSCQCGVCTAPCTSDAACSRFPGATCETASAACGSAPASCDVRCSVPSDCRALGAAFSCVDDRCRSSGPDAGTGGATGSGGASGGSGGASGGTSAGGTSAGGRNTGAADAGGASSGGRTADSGSCGDAGEPCCDPFPGDGPNYCNGDLRCGEGNVCFDCECALGAYIPVCGVDGLTYDATCGRACVPVAVACEGQCPCTPAPSCPAAPPADSPCSPRGTVCFYEDCSTYGRARAECQGNWQLQTTPCDPIVCGPDTCAAGQACITRAGGALLIDCTPMTCNGAVACDCVQGCTPECTLTSTLEDGVSVYCNTCPQGSCP